MRNFTFYLLLFLAASCQQKPVETEGTTQPTPTAAPLVAAATASATSTTARQVSPLISGYWISARYLDAVARTRSPKPAITDFPNVPVTMLIEPAAATADSMHAGLVLRLHEGSDMTILLRPGHSAGSLLARTALGEAANTRYELAYQLTATDTVLYFIKRDQRHQREISRFAYRRVARGVGSKEYVAQLNDEIARTLGQQLVVGSYLCTDSAGRPLKVQFLPNGQVIGLPFRTYHVLEDFLGGPVGGDALIFDMYSTPDHQLTLAATYGRDTLRLYRQYETTEIPPGGTDSLLIVKRGRLAYQLIRLKKP